MPRRRPADNAASNKWRGQAVIRVGWASFVGATGDNASHAHHAIQLAVGLDTAIELSIADAAPQRAVAFVIGPDVRHRLTPANNVGLLYVDAETVWGRRLQALCGRSVWMPPRDVAAGLHSLFARGMNDDFPDRIVEVIFGAENSPSPLPEIDHRIERVIGELPTRIRSPNPLSALADRVHLSPGRFAHVFKASTGLPWRPYVRWLRLQSAMQEAAGGASLTLAAHAAGFADHAHLTRTFRRAFGITPTDVLRMAKINRPND